MELDVEVALKGRGFWALIFKCRDRAPVPNVTGNSEAAQIKRSIQQSEKRVCFEIMKPARKCFFAGRTNERLPLAIVELTLSPKMPQKTRSTGSLRT